MPNNQKRAGRAYKEPKQIQAYDLFLTTELPAEEIGRRVGASGRSILYWIEYGKWREKKDDIRLQAKKSSETKAFDEYEKSYKEIFEILFQLIPKIKSSLETIDFSDVKITEALYAINTLTQSLNQMAAFKNRIEKIYDPKFVILTIIESMNEEPKWRKFIERNGNSLVEKFIGKITEV